jgi:hypothetical protein
MDATLDAVMMVDVMRDRVMEYYVIKALDVSLIM